MSNTIELQHPNRKSINLGLLDEEENPALASLSDGAYRLYLNMLVWSEEEDGLADISQYAPRSFENLTNAFEIERAGLIQRAFHLTDAGEEIFDGTFFVPVSDELTH